MANLLTGLTGVLKTDVITISKSFGALIFTMSKPYADLTNQVITVWIERSNGNNVYLANKVLLKDFVTLLLTQQGDAVQNDGANYVYVLELGHEAGIVIGEGERFKFQLEGLLAPDVMSIDYTEDYVNTLAYMKFEAKSVNAGERDRTFQCAEMERVIIDKKAALGDIGITYQGNTEKRFTPFELKTLHVQSQEVLVYKPDGMVQQHPSDKLVIPLIGVQSIRLYTDGSAVVPMTFMLMDELIPEQHYTKPAIKFGSRSYR